MRGRIMMSNHALGMSYICNRVSVLHMYAQVARDILMTARARAPQGRASEIETRVRSEQEELCQADSSTLITGINEIIARKQFNRGQPLHPREQGGGVYKLGSKSDHKLDIDQGFKLCCKSDAKSHLKLDIKPGSKLNSKSSLKLSNRVGFQVKFQVKNPS